MGKIDENKLQKRERLLDEAFRHFTAKGIAKTTISDIVNSAGVAKGTFYLYFTDKYDLAGKLIASKARSMFTHALKNMKNSGAETPEDKILFLIDDILASFSRRPKLLRFIEKNLSWGVFKDALSGDDAGNPDYLETFNKLLGDPEDWHDTYTMLYLIIELVGSSCYSIILEKDPMTMEEFRPHLHAAVRAIMQGFRVQH